MKPVALLFCFREPNHNQWQSGDPALCSSAEAFFFFGELANSTRNQFLHIQALNSASTYPEIVPVGFHPLGAMLILAFGFIPAVLLLGLLGSRIPASFDQIQSLSEVPDARSGRGISCVNGSRISAKIFWAALRQACPLTILAILLLFMVLVQNGLINGLNQNLEVILNPKAGKFSTLGIPVTLDTFYNASLLGMFGMLVLLAVQGWLYPKQPNAPCALPRLHVNFKGVFGFSLLLNLLLFLMVRAQLRGFFAAYSAPEIIIGAAGIDPNLNR